MTRQESIRKRNNNTKSLFRAILIECIIAIGCFIFFSINSSHYFGLIGVLFYITSSASCVYINQTRTFDNLDIEEIFFGSVQRTVLILLSVIIIIIRQNFFLLELVLIALIPLCNFIEIILEVLCGKWQIFSKQ